MSKRLSSFLLGFVSASDYGKGKKLPEGTRRLFATACLQGIAFSIAITLEANAFVLASATDLAASLPIIVFGLGGGGLLLLALARFAAWFSARACSAALAFGYGAAGIAFAASLASGGAGAWLAVGGGILSVLLPFAMSSWSCLMSRLSRSIAMVCGCISFSAAAALLILTCIDPRLFGALLLASCVVGFVGAVLARREPPETAGDAVGASREQVALAGCEAGSGEGKLWGILLSVPCLGEFLLFLTTGIVTQRMTLDSGSSIVATAFAVAIACLGLVFFYRHRRKKGEANALFRLFDIALPGLAIVSIAVKMIPLESISLSVYPSFNKAYFLVLGAALWIKLGFFGIENRSSLPRVCAGIAIGCACSLGIGRIISMGGSFVSNICLGLFTGIFVVVAIVNMGYNLVLYAKGADSEVEPAPEAPGFAELCFRIGGQFGLSSRECEVLVELAYGHSSGYIATVLYISANTVRSHMKNIYKKLGVGSREELIEFIRNQPRS